MNLPLNRSKTPTIVLCLLLSLIIVFSLLAKGPNQPLVAAPLGVDPAPLARSCPPGMECDIDGSSENWLKSEQGYYYGTLAYGPTQRIASATDISPLATYGPDGFGYTSNDGVTCTPFEIHKDELAINTGLNGATPGQAIGPIELSFPFKYYEKTYTHIYIAASGYISFMDSADWPSQSRIG